MTMTGSVIDAAQLGNLLDLMDGDANLVIEVIDLFLEDAPLRMSSIADAIDRADPESLMRSAHSLKGSSANVGAKGLTGLCANLEQKGRNGSVAGAPALALSMRREFEAVRNALEEERQRLRASLIGGAGDSRVAV